RLRGHPVPALRLGARTGYPWQQRLAPGRPRGAAGHARRGHPHPGHPTSARAGGGAQCRGAPGGSHGCREGGCHSVSGASTAENFAVRLLAGAREHPDRIAIRQGTVRISYGLLARRVRKLAGALRDDGVGPGDRVALLFPNDHRFIEALLATVWLGAVAVPLNTRAGTAALDYVMADATPRVLLGHVSLRERADGLAEPANVPVILADEQQWHGLAADSMHQEAVAEAGAAAQAQPDESSGPGAGDAAAPVAETDVCFQPYTSGSTGNPKGCLLSHGGQYWNAATVAEVWQLRDDDRGLVTAPLYHKNAPICVVKPLLLVGGTIVIGRSSDPRTIPAEVAEHGCTYTTGVPATYEMLLAS